MSALHIACAADGRYVPHSAAMLHSVLEHSGGHEVQVHYLHGPDFPAGAASRLAEMVERHGGRLALHNVPDEQISELPTWDYITAPMWYRIFLPELLPEVERIVYLDIDLIAVDSLAPLWATELGDAYLAAVSNVFQLDHLHRPEALGLQGPAAYFNSGVLLMNLELMRDDGCSTALRDYAVTHGDELLWPDQDAFNVVLGPRRLPLHPRWNCMNSVLHFPWSPYVFGTAAVAEARRNPAIRHFEGPEANKPWHYLCQSEMREVYFEHRRQTPWRECRPEGRTPRNVVRRVRRGLGRRAASGVSRLRRHLSA